jgi:hypothetical protein
MERSRAGWGRHATNTALYAVPTFVGKKTQAPLGSFLRKDLLIQDENNHDDLAAWMATRCDEAPLTVLLMGRCDVDHESFNTGLILVESYELGVPHWRRVGVCIWLHSYLSEGEDVRPLWELLRGDSPD